MIDREEEKGENGQNVKRGGKDIRRTRKTERA